MSWSLKRTMKTKYPCQFCEKRTAECHATCEEYLTVQKQRQKELEEIRKANEADAALAINTRERKFDYLRGRKVGK